ncbi:unnamed protein product [Orchesella dallaii]|uniref:Uncharacterized protein n=1 Tax=Orchesella dallaii TaxID=48710 RepID=A0ABP1QBE9_9HEXA
MKEKLDRKMGDISRLIRPFINILIIILHLPSFGAGTDNKSDPVTDALLNDDMFSILRQYEDSACLIITEKAYLDLFSGHRNYGETCELRGDENKRDQYCKLYVEDSVNSCLIPTHLTCDPITKRCVCSDGSNILPPIHFQFGNEEKQTKTLEKGRCFIRPTFPTVDGIECTPGSSPNKTVNDEDDDVWYCACENQHNPDYLNTSNPEWWRCRGSLLSSCTGFEILALIFVAALRNRHLHLFV